MVEYVPTDPTVVPGRCKNTGTENVLLLPAVSVCSFLPASALRDGCTPVLGLRIVVSRALRRHSGQLLWQRQSGSFQTLRRPCGPVAVAANCPRGNTALSFQACGHPWRVRRDFCTSSSSFLARGRPSLVVSNTLGVFPFVSRHGVRGSCRRGAEDSQARGLSGRTDRRPTQEPTKPNAVSWFLSGRGHHFPESCGRDVGLRRTLRRACPCLLVAVARLAGRWCFWRLCFWRRCLSLAVGLGSLFRVPFRGRRPEHRRYFPRCSGTLVPCIRSTESAGPLVASVVTDQMVGVRRSPWATRLGERGCVHLPPTIAFWPPTVPKFLTDVRCASGGSCTSDGCDVAASVLTRCRGSRISRP